MRPKLVWIAVLMLALAAGTLSCGGGGGGPALGNDALDLVWDGGYWDQRNWK